jgi:hypothetical protein
MSGVIKVLVVDAFGSHDVGERRSKAFLRLVRESLRTVSQESSFCVMIRGSADLAELVFDRTLPDLDNEEVSTQFFSQESHRQA